MPRDLWTWQIDAQRIADLSTTDPERVAGLSKRRRATLARRLQRHPRTKRIPARLTRALPVPRQRRDPRRDSATPAYNPPRCELAAAGLTLALHNPAPEVLGVGIAAVAIQLARQRLELPQIKRAVGPLTLTGLFALSIAVGVLARSWNGPARLLTHAGLWGTAGIGAIASITINNLPAAMLLSAQPVSHARALLLGLNLGPNLAVSGSLSAYLWFKAARQIDTRPSLRAFTRRGLLLAPAAIITALTASTLLPG
jgi:hypothetical protein